MVRTAFSVLVLLLFAVEVQSRFVPKNSTDLVSDGILHGQQTSVLLLEHSASSSSSETCEMTYGFLPCTTTIFGNLFLVVVYGYLMFLGATCLSNGCELLLEILGPGIIGGLFLPILGALPDALLILVSGLSGSKETAQQQVLIGMGLLAGSTVMLLTLLWGSCVIVGKCDLSEGSTAVDLQDTKGFSLTGSGITTDKLTSYAARIMVISIAPFIIVQIPQVFHLSSGRRIAVLVALIVSILCLLSYCLFQVFQPWVQKRKIEYAKLRHVMSSVLNNAQKRALGKLYTEDGKPNEDIIRKLFHAIDLNSDAKVSSSEFRALLVGINFADLGLNEQDALQKVMADFDSSSDSYIDENEFVNGLSRWLHDADRTVTEPTHHSKKLHHYHLRTWEEHNMLLDKSEEDGDDIGSPSWIFFKAVMLLLLGTAVAAIFADPLVDAVDNFSSATSIPSFFISFIAMPLATNSSEAVAAIIFASRKKQRTASLTFSEIYGAVTMNNVLCLAVFLAIVYIRQLTWDFSAEVLVILIVVVIMGLFTSFRTTFQLWTCIVAILLYPLSLVLVYVLDYILGWS